MRSPTQLGAVLFPFGLVCLDVSLALLDAARLEVLLSVRSAACFGFATFVFGLTCSGLVSSIFDIVSLEAVLPPQSPS